MWLFIVSPKSGDTMDHAWSLFASICASTSAEISCVQPKGHNSFEISFQLDKWLAMAEIWPPHSFGSPGKIVLWEVKNVKNFDYCLCSNYRAPFLSDLFDI